MHRCSLRKMFGILPVSSGNCFHLVKNKNSMMNLAPLLKMTPPQRNFFVVCIIFLFAVFFVLMWYIARESNFMNLEDRSEGAFPGRSARVKSAEERLRLVATEAKIITGTIEQVTTLKTESAKFLRVRAFVIDRNQLSKAGGALSSNLPMVEETFEVTVNEKTNIKGGGGISSIQSGDFVSIMTLEGIYDAKRLTAVSIEKFSGNTAPRNTKTRQ